MSDCAAIRVGFRFVPRNLCGRGRAECWRKGGGRLYSGEMVRSRGRLLRAGRIMSGERVEREMEERVCIVGGEGQVEYDGGGCCCGRWWTDMVVVAAVVGGWS